MAKDDKIKTTLTDSDITTSRPTGRREFLGTMAVTGAVAGVTGSLLAGGAQAQSLTDSDNGSWADSAGCGRGSGGVFTGLTDADNGSAGTDAGGYGRGAPYC
jgi:hypothetical protein